MSCRPDRGAASVVSVAPGPRQAGSGVAQACTSCRHDSRPWCGPSCPALHAPLQAHPELVDEGDAGGVLGHKADGDAHHHPPPVVDLVLFRPAKHPAEKVGRQEQMRSGRWAARGRRRGGADGTACMLHGQGGGRGSQEVEFVIPSGFRLRCSDLHAITDPRLALCAGSSLVVARHAHMQQQKGHGCNAWANKRCQWHGPATAATGQSAKTLR